jgi:hypothetical protein
MIFVLGGILACTYNAWIVGSRVRRAYRQGIWLGFRRVPAWRAKNPRRFWAWTVINAAICAGFLAAAAYLAWSVFAIVSFSN